MGKVSTREDLVANAYGKLSLFSFTTLILCLWGCNNLSMDKARVLSSQKEQVFSFKHLSSIQLLDLAGEYLGFDYLYEPDQIPNEAITLKMHGKLQGEVLVKDFYGLLEAILISILPT